MRSQQPYYRPMDPVRLRRIANAGVPLGLGSFALSVALGAAVVYLALTWVTKAPLLAMAVGTEGALALIVLLFGCVTMTMRSTVSTGHFEMVAAATLRRNVLVLWNFGMLLACLGCFTLVVGLSMLRAYTGIAPYLAGVVAPVTTVVYLGFVAVYVSRLLRS